MFEIVLMVKNRPARGIFKLHQFIINYDSANARDFLSDGDVYFSIISNINIKILKAILLENEALFLF
jgi:hypothetical protein